MGGGYNGSSNPLHSGWVSPSGVEVASGEEGGERSGHGCCQEPLGGLRREMGPSPRSWSHQGDRQELDWACRLGKLDSPCDHTWGELNTPWDPPNMCTLTLRCLVVMVVQMDPLLGWWSQATPSPSIRLLPHFMDSLGQLSLGFQKVQIIRSTCPNRGWSYREVLDRGGGETGRGA